MKSNPYPKLKKAVSVCHTDSNIDAELEAGNIRINDFFREEEDRLVFTLQFQWREDSDSL